jgi:hypothetical protein
MGPGIGTPKYTDRYILFAGGRDRIFFLVTIFDPVGTPLKTECRAFSGKTRGIYFESTLGTKVHPLEEY